MPTLIEGILARLGAALAEEDSVEMSGSPGPDTYPFIVVDDLQFGQVRFNTKRFPDGTRPVETEHNFQVTVASLDPEEASAIGKKAYNALMPASTDRPRIIIDDGYEVNRIPVSGRTYSQDGAGPNLLKVFYFQFDIRMHLGETV